jgi:AcrR family transcriptional regulator
MTPANTIATSPGRPRAGIDAIVFAAALGTVHELGYSGATMDRIATAAGVAKTTLYRRWPSKGALVTDCLVDAFGPVETLSPSGPLPLRGARRDEFLSSVMRWFAGRLTEPGLGAAFAGVFVDAVGDPSLREVLATRLQAPYLRVLQEVLGEPEERVLLVIDVVAGTMLHRMGMTGAPMADADVTALLEMVVHYLAGSIPVAAASTMTDALPR